MRNCRKKSNKNRKRFAESTDEINRLLVGEDGEEGQRSISMNFSICSAPEIIVKQLNFL